jgi:hypothetical protein
MGIVENCEDLGVATTRCRLAPINANQCLTPPCDHMAPPELAQIHMERLWGPASEPSRILMRDSSSSKRSREEQMLDTLMLVLGFGMFVLLLGYVAICDRI